jgi:flagellar operon protein
VSDVIDIKQLEMLIKNQKTDTTSSVSGLKDGPSALKDLVKNDNKFKNLLSQENTRLTSNELKFSNHAITRLYSRNLHLTNIEKQKIVEGVNKLKTKGAKEALMLVKDIAMIVSVDNKTVVTVMDDKGSSGDGIFTNIDSAMIV